MATDQPHRTFETTTASLMALSDWLTEHKCTHIAIEATSVYWKLVWHILADGDFQLVLAHAACICPRNDESVGKRRSNRLRKRAPWLKTTLVQSAWAAVNKKGSYLRAQFYRITARRGAKKVIVAVAASILTAIYHMLKDGTTYRGLGPRHFDRRSEAQHTRHLVRRLADLG
jgi:hypothetical protein